MGRPWSQDFQCPSCELKFNRIIEHADRHSPVPCEREDCPSLAGPVIGMPKPLRASFHDGVKRKGFAEGVLASELESASFELPVSERGQIDKEIAKLRRSDS